MFFTSIVSEKHKISTLTPYTPLYYGNNPTTLSINLPFLPVSWTAPKVICRAEMLDWKGVAPKPIRRRSRNAMLKDVSCRNVFKIGNTSV